MFIDKKTERIHMLCVREHIEEVCFDCPRHTICDLKDLVECVKLRFVNEPLDVDHTEE